MAPIAADMGKALGSSPQEIGWIIGLLFIAPTLGSTLGGSAVDRYGARPMLAGACVLIVIANAICYISDS
ncbi:MFS transporter, partial [Acinetobacter baumannii]